MPTYPSIYDGPPRNYTRTRTAKSYIAIHNTSNDASAEAEASYAKRRTDSVSSHYYVDSTSIVQSLDTDYRAWHAGNREGNDRAIAYEITGVNGWTRTQWLDRVAWGLLAAQIRKDCAAHNIVPRDLTVAQIKVGSLTGVITHNDMRLAWGGTTHTDPGPNFPMDHLIALVGEEEDDMPLSDSDLDKIFNVVWKRDGIAAPSQAPSRKTNPDWRGESYLSSIRNNAVEAANKAGEAVALAAIAAGKDVTEAVRAELTRHRALLVTELEASLGPAVLAGLREHLDDVADERLVAAAAAGTRWALGSLDETASPA